MEFSGKRVLIVGMALSGISSAERLKKLKSDVTIVDCANSPELVKRAGELDKRGIGSRLGPHLHSDLDEKDLVVVSPGIPSNNTLIVEAKKRNIPVWSEIELACRLTKSPIIGISGTNGKTTTTVLVGEIFKEAGRRSAVAGNIGFPLARAVDATPDTVFIVELSSFQLQNIERFRPHISVLLNITEDHLDWHPDFADYVRAKSRLFLNQTESDFAVMNFDDQIVADISSSLESSVIPFSKYRKFERGIFLDNGKIIAVLDEREEICSLDELKIRGEHNIDNAMAAVAVSMIMGIPALAIREALRKFKGIEHRIEFVAAVDSVEYFNDSKATNPDATVKALGSFSSPIVLLAGGRNKGNSFSGLASAIRRSARAAILFGEAAGEIQPLIKNSDLTVVRVETVPEAVKEARNLSRQGDTVLFSPACASFDQFSSYKERGHVFKDAVANLEKRQ